ncbi:putative inactive poly [ADP-ribose] polymerase SRO1 [Acorus gramineus]|uniref:Inactive poly [ADP-ribose] polymerase SRO1 n=1 Tax=Acorus gramineus TaxID=55184 RepID=A0AAV9AJ48_ACOGR|nr:putative inactive poly [ADP-ribose] polymerase SRO1 [Acorus gramineus]
MYFEGDSWIAFEDDLVFSLVEGFRTGRSEVMISLDSVEHLFDYLAMSLIEPKSGTRRPVAWFDEEGMCFFPSNHSDGMGLTASLKSCDVDDDGLHYMLLCRIIMGNMEEMQSGNQFCPRQENFDSAVDNLEKPKCYMIWSSQTKANIYPEFVISFKLAPYIRGSYGA